MKPKLRAALAGGVATVAIAGTSLLAFASASYAGPNTPPWEPDPAVTHNSTDPGYGELAFYDANGDQITSGTSQSSLATYVAGTTTLPNGGNTANLYWAVPKSGTPTAGWATHVIGTTNTNFSTLPAATPAPIKAFVTNGTTGYPVYSSGSSGALNLSNFLASNPTLDSSTGFQDPTGKVHLLQIRMVIPSDLTSLPTGPYYEADIAFSTQTSGTPITFDGVTVPNSGWAEVFPPATQVTPTLSATQSGTVTAGTAESLTATVPTGDVGSINFFDNGTLLGNVPLTTGTGNLTATFPTTAGSYTPGNGAHSYTAIFVPGNGSGTAGTGPSDETNPNTATDATLAGDTPSSAVALTEQVPLTATHTSISENNTTAKFNDPSETALVFTATVTETDSGSAGITGGSVNFYLGGTVSGSNYTPGTLLGPGTYSVTGTTGTATFSPTSQTQLPVGADNVFAVFTPASAEQNTYAGSFSNPPATVTVSAPAACSNTGSICSDQQNIQVTVSPGTITISTPYTQGNPFVLPNLTLSPDGTYLASSATFPSPAAGSPSTTVSTVPANPNVTSFSGGTLSVASTTGFQNQGTISVSTTNGSQASTAELTYTGVTATSFTGVDYSAGSGNITATSTVSGPPQDIVVTSTLSPAYGWTLSVAASNLTGPGGTIPSTGLGLTNGTLLNGGSGAGNYSGAITFTPIPALNPSSADSAGTGPGLKSQPQTWAQSTAVDGTALLNGTLTLLAPTSTQSGTYGGTITFSVS